MIGGPSKGPDGPLPRACWNTFRAGGATYVSPALQGGEQVHKLDPGVPEGWRWKDGSSHASSLKCQLSTVTPAKPGDLTASG